MSLCDSWFGIFWSKEFLFSISKVNRYFQTEETNGVVNIRLVFRTRSCLIHIFIIQIFIFYVHSDVFMWFGYFLDVLLQLFLWRKISRFDNQDYDSILRLLNFCLSKCNYVTVLYMALANGWARYQQLFLIIPIYEGFRVIVD